MVAGLQSTWLRAPECSNTPYGWPYSRRVPTLAVATHSSSNSSMLRCSRSWESGGEIIGLDVGKKHAMEEDKRTNMWASGAEHRALCSLPPQRQDGLASSFKQMCSSHAVQVREKNWLVWGICIYWTQHNNSPLDKVANAMQLSALSPKWRCNLPHPG